MPAPATSKPKGGGAKDKRNQRRTRTQGQLREQISDMHLRDSLDHDGAAPARPRPRPKSGRSSKPREADAHVFSALEHANASCRFVVKEDCGLRPSGLDVDHPIGFKQLWRVYAPPEECPICLETCEVPRMLTCGHLMCLHCLINHNAFSPTAEVCPICGDVVSPNPFRTVPVTFLSQRAAKPAVGSEAEFVLMRRSAQSTLALPASVGTQELLRADRFPEPVFAEFARVCQAGGEWARQELAGDLRQLLGARKAYVQEFGSTDAAQGGYARAIQVVKQSLDAVQHDLDAGAGEPAAEAKKRGKKAGDEQQFSYYQMCFESPTLYTLSSLDVSILKAQFGSYANFPYSLSGKIEDVHLERLSKSNPRFKYLGHLPDHTALALVDCDWTGVVDPDVLSQFEGKIAERRSARAAQAAREFRETVKAEMNLENQFKFEVAEALNPTSAWSNSQVSIDTSMLPALPVKKPKESTEAANPSSKWVDQEKQFEAVMKNAYVPKRGRKDVIIRF